MRYDTTNHEVTLIWSDRAAELYGYNILILPNGSQIYFTCQTDESKYGPWRNTYLWDDTVEVAKIPPNTKHRIDCNFRTNLSRGLYYIKPQYEIDPNDIKWLDTLADLIRRYESKIELGLAELTRSYRCKNY